MGQVIDYAKELQRFSYEAFEVAIRRAELAGNAARTDSLYQRAGAAAAGVDEKGFIDAISRNLRRGRFLLLVVGDGIHEGVQTITDFLQQHAGMHFTLALVEVAIFQAHAGGYLVQPRVLAKTEMVPRGVVWVRDELVMVDPVAEGGRGTAPSRMPATISEARLYEELDTVLPGGAARLRRLVAALEDLGVSQRFTPTLIVLRGAVAGQMVPLNSIEASKAKVWFDNVVGQATALGRRGAATAYYQALAALVRDDARRADKLNPRGETASLPLDDLLSRQDDWLAAVKVYLQAFSDVTPAADM